jgi:hypothetical protein
MATVSPDEIWTEVLAVLARPPVPVDDGQLELFDIDNDNDKEEQQHS